jgi:hypothetical protein
MRDEQLQKLLQDADAEQNVATFVAAEMTGRVRLRYQKERRNRRVLVVAGPLVVMLLGIAGWRISDIHSVRPGVETQAVRRPLESQPSNTKSATLTADEIHRLEAEAALHLRVARRIAEMRRHDLALDEAGRDRDAQEDGESIREQLDIVAYRMILRADGLRAAMRSVEEVIVIYQDVVRLFPTTSSAELARKRLTELGAFKGDT